MFRRGGFFDHARSLPACQYIAKANFAGKVFLPAEDIEEARKFADQTLSVAIRNVLITPAGRIFYAKYGGVFWPLRIKAVKEGSVVGAQNAIITIENNRSGVLLADQTGPKRFLLQVWYPVTVATLSRRNKNKPLVKALGAHPAIRHSCHTKLHDFWPSGE